MVQPIRVKLKILIFYTYNQGLLSSFFQEFSKKLFEEGHEVVNFFLKHKDEKFVQDGVLIYGKKRGSYFSNYKNIYRVIKNEKPDVVLSNFSYVNPALLFGRLLGVKRNIVWFHTVYGHSKPNKLIVLNKSLFLKLANIVITNSSVLDIDMVTKYGVRKNRLRCVPFWTNICALEAHDISANIGGQDAQFKIGCPGRLVADKNHELVIKSIPVLIHKTKSVKLYIAGDGPYKSNLQQLVKELNLQDHVVFLGLLSSNQMVTFYKNMDLVVLPSKHEAFGLVFIEAIALGVPVLISSQFGSLSFVNQDSFDLKPFIFDPYSLEDLTEKMQSYLQNAPIEKVFFRSIYEETFEKKQIFDKLKLILLKN